MSESQQTHVCLSVPFVRCSATVYFHTGGSGVFARDADAFVVVVSARVRGCFFFSCPQQKLEIRLKQSSPQRLVYFVL